METIRDRVAGLDVHRDRVVACVRLVDEGGRVRSHKRSFSTMTEGVIELAYWLNEHSVTTGVMESTGVYWKSVYYGLEGLVSGLWLVNASHVKRVPGQKTDISDAEWLADVAAHGMVRPSYVPPPPIRALRELTRYRKTQVDARVREIQRLEKLLQDAGIKVSSVASGSWSQSVRAMVEALITGERGPGCVGRHVQEPDAGQEGPPRAGPRRQLRRPPRCCGPPDHRPHRLSRRLDPSLVGRDC